MKPLQVVSACNICCEEKPCADTRYFSNCRHSNCHSCIQEWIRTAEGRGRHPTCPSCRVELTENDVFLILGRPFQPQEEDSDDDDDDESYFLPGSIGSPSIVDSLELYHFWSDYEDDDDDEDDSDYEEEDVDYEDGSDEDETSYGDPESIESEDSSGWSESYSTSSDDSCSFDEYSSDSEESDDTDDGIPNNPHCRHFATDTGRPRIPQRTPSVAQISASEQPAPERKVKASKSLPVQPSHALRSKKQPYRTISINELNRQGTML